MKNGRVIFTSIYYQCTIIYDEHTEKNVKLIEQV